MILSAEILSETVKQRRDMDNLYSESEETINIFKTECENILKDFAEELEKYEEEQKTEIITKLMRDAHSVKGSAAIVGLTKVQKSAHEIEDILSKIQDNKKTNLSANIARIKNLIFEIINEIRQSEDIYEKALKTVSMLKTDKTSADRLAEIAEIITEKIPTPQVADITNTLKNIFIKLKNADSINNNIVNTLSGAFKILKKVSASNTTEVNEELFFLKQRLSVTEQMIVVKEIKTETKTNPVKTDIKEILKTLGQNSIQTVRIETSKLDSLYENICSLENVFRQEEERNKKITEITEKLSEKIFETEKTIAKIKEFLTNNKVTEKEIDGKVLKSENNIEEIQKIITDFTEKTNNHPNFNKYFSNIKQTISKVRTLPVGVILHMFPRMVRDIANSENKEVDIVITGSETGADKKILEEIKIPLIHLLRNAVDHGIELPEEREKNNKPAVGKITISAKNTDGILKISVKDDGCGINFDKIKEKALREKLLGKTEIKKFKKNDFIKMIFRPGFTTEDKVTEISGRGMGLDIAYTKVSELNGQIHINTQQGKGTEVVIEIPVDNGTNSDNKKPAKKIEIKKIPRAEDSKTTAIFFTKILKKNGYDVMTCTNGKEALEELKRNHYDLLVTDIEMPVMNGAELVLKMKGTKSLKEIPVVVISMLSLKRSNQLFKNIPVNAIITKTDFNEEKFAQEIKNILYS